jgi:hypothetical protein
VVVIVVVSFRPQHDRQGRSTYMRRLNAVLVLGQRLWPCTDAERRRKHREKLKNEQAGTPE